MNYYALMIVSEKKIIVRHDGRRKIITFTTDLNSHAIRRFYNNEFVVEGVPGDFTAKGLTAKNHCDDNFKNVAGSGGSPLSAIMDWFKKIVDLFAYDPLGNIRKEKNR